MAQGTGSAPSDLDRLGPAVQLHATYIGNLNNMLGFYLIIAGFLFAGVFQLITADKSLPILAGVVALLGVFATIMFHMMDSRSRVILAHIEGIMAELEWSVYSRGRRPSRDIPPSRSFKSANIVGDPKAKKLCLRPRGFYSLVRLIYWVFGIALGLLAITAFGLAAWDAAHRPAEPPPPRETSINVEISTTNVKRCCVKPTMQAVKEAPERQ